MTDLKKWAFKHRTYLKLEDGVPVTCRYIGYEEFVDKEQEDKDKIRYHFEVDNTEKILESQSIVLAEEMSKFEIGDWIKLKRSGKGRQTKYEVKLVEKNKEKISDEDLEKVETKKPPKKK